MCFKRCLYTELHNIAVYYAADKHITTLATELQDPSYFHAVIKIKI